MWTLRIFGIAIAFYLTAGLARSEAQDAPNYVVSYIEIMPSGRATTLHLLRALRAASRAEAGNNGFDILRRNGRLRQFAILEVWKDARALASHAGAPTTKQFLGKLKPLLAAPIDVRLHSGFAVGRPQIAGARALYVLTHVDLIGAKKDEGLAALRQLSADSAKDPGILRFDVLQQISRPNHMTLVEAWRSKAAFEEHGVASHTRQFRDALLPMSGSLYDQRLYRMIH